MSGDEMEIDPDSDSETNLQETDIKLPEALVHGRQRRSTAGNRLHDILSQQLEVEEIFQEDENDREFAGVDEFKDEVESDFDDAEDDEVAEDEGERKLAQEVKEAQKAKKRKAVEFVVRPRAAAGSKQVDEARPQIKASLRVHQVQDRANRRRSSRGATVQNAEVLDEKLKRNRERRSKMVIPERVIEKKMTQKERLAQAVVTERKNVASLKRIVELEAMRKQDRDAILSKKRVIDEPIISWKSSKITEYTPMPPAHEDTLAGGGTEEQVAAGENRMGGVSEREEQEQWHDLYERSTVILDNFDPAFLRDPSTVKQVLFDTTSKPTSIVARWAGCRANLCQKLNATFVLLADGRLDTAIRCLALATIR
ncbi:Vacuolar protein sorting-associated protein 72 [Neolecta irregularis DAH-3]|uniref:Vacuolar protein sorting-associated protein 72 n=1 Tax=Neolecta irregularis (strain DAH-3) TaxID=1198029 RepID=A0A1U7LIF8_NEOID|nr:Vacuolar protein sorting-associated protein 72 [Neolecta irregularis DAH-3]|eukprot:OLL22446.1 Vacuolar protein sorting-associated protein 72 [Neolecta irregularis DAH-3]